MKKRRELDALVNGKTGRRKKKGQHELLRNDTDSSDVEDFAIPPKAIARKHNSLSRFCSACVTVCGFFLLTSCMVAIAGLVWVHVELKREVDNLRTEVDKVKSDHDTSNTDYEAVRTQQIDIKKQLEVLKTALDEQKKSLSGLTKNFHDLQTDVQHAHLNRSEVQKMRRLPSKLDELQSQAATVGSDINNIKQDVTTLQQAKTDMVHDLQQIQDQLADIKTPDSTTALPAPLAAPAQAAQEDINRLTRAIASVNQSLSEQFYSLQSRSDLHQSQLVNMTQRLDQRISILELHPSTEISVNNGDMDELVRHAVEEALLDTSHAGSSGNITHRVDLLSESVSLLQIQCAAVNVTKLIQDSTALETTYINDKLYVVNNAMETMKERVTTIEDHVQYLLTLEPTQQHLNTPAPTNNTISTKVQPTVSSVPASQSKDVGSADSSSDLYNESGSSLRSDQQQQDGK